MEHEHWNKLSTEDIDVRYIDVIDRLIPPTQKRIDAMVKSLGERGQLTPILVIKHALHWRVVAGATRLAAAKELKWPTIEATIISVDNEFEAQLIEIAENLERSDLSDSERTKLKEQDKELRIRQLALFDERIKHPHPAMTTPAKARRHVATGAPKGRPKGGASEAGRQAGIPASTARRRAKAISAQNKNERKKPFERERRDEEPNEAVPARTASTIESKGSWRVHATDADGGSWSSGVRLATIEEASRYMTHIAVSDLYNMGVVLVELRVIPSDDEPNVGFGRDKKGQLGDLGFKHGDCGLLAWHRDGGRAEAHSRSAGNGVDAAELAAARKAAHADDELGPTR